MPHYQEDEERRVVRTEEFATRAARNLYNLRQQVRQIQREILSLGPDSKMKPTKKVFLLGQALLTEATHN